MGDNITVLAKGKRIASDIDDVEVITSLAWRKNRRMNSGTKNSVTINGGATSNTGANSDDVNGFQTQNINGVTFKIGHNITSAMDPNKLKRMLSNRVSARRTTRRKCQRIEELENKVKSLEAGISVLQTRVSIFQGQNYRLDMEKKKLNCEIFVQSTKASRIKSEIEERQAEVNRLTCQQHYNNNLHQHNLQPYSMSTVNSIQASPQVGNFGQQNLTYELNNPIPSLDQAEIFAKNAEVNRLMGQQPYNNNLQQQNLQPYTMCPVNSKLASPGVGNFDQQNFDYFKLQSCNGFGEFNNPIPSLDQEGGYHIAGSNKIDEVNLFQNQLNNTTSHDQCDIDMSDSYFPASSSGDNWWAEEGMLEQLLMSPPPQPQNDAANLVDYCLDNNDHQEIMNLYMWS